MEDHKTYTENILYMKSNVRNYTIEAAKWIKKLQFTKIEPSNMEIGRFYFIRYDYSKKNKSSKMEQNVPLLVVDYKPLIDSRVLYILNFNFLPLNIKQAIFSEFTNMFATQYINNTTFPINYKYMWDFLIKYAFEYCIREIRLDLIHEVYSIPHSDLHMLTSINTQFLTGVDEGKLNDIWISKLKSESFEQRYDELLTIKTNYYKILEELQNKFKNLKP